MVNRYTLVNPHIVGTLNTTVDAPTSSVAAKELYGRLSPYFRNAVPNLVFTIQKVKSKSSQIGGGSEKSYYSFRVKEIQQNGGEVVYTISTVPDKINVNALNGFLSKINNKISKKISLVDSEQQDNYQSQSQSGAGKNSDSESESFNRLLEEIEDEEDDEDIVPRRKNKSYNPVYTNTISSLVIPAVVDPISYWSYIPTIYDISRVVVPTFIPTITPNVIIDLGDLP